MRDKFSSQMMWNCQLVIGFGWDLSIDHMIILAVRCRSWIDGVSVVDSFEFCSIYFIYYNID